MTSNILSDLGVQLSTINSLQTQQQNLQQLNEELSSGVQYSDLTDYSPTQASQLMNFNNGITQRQGYLSAMNTVNANLSVMSNSLTGLQSVIQQAIQAVNAAPTQAQAQSTGTEQQIQGMMSNFSFYLNTQSSPGDYVFNGSRNNTQPVINDISTITGTGAPTETMPFTAVTSPNLPTYDTEYPATDANAYTQSSVAIDSSLTLTYGVSSDNPAFQQMALGLRWAYAATNAPDEATYQTDMTNARTLLTGAETGVQALQSSVASSQATVTQTQALQNQDINDLTTQIDNIQQVDISSVGVKLTLLQTQLQASYSATAKLTQLSILNYL